MSLDCVKPVKEKDGQRDSERAERDVERGTERNETQLVDSLDVVTALLYLLVVALTT